jgi:hypothetical protein
MTTIADLDAMLTRGETITFYGEHTYRIEAVGECDGQTCRLPNCVGHLFLRHVTVGVRLEAAVAPDGTYY